MDTLANRNNNPGNLKDPNTGTFRQFNSPQEGYAALLNDLEAKKTGKSQTGIKPENTLTDFAKVYAPSSDNNNPAQYAANLANHMKVRPDAPISSLDTGKWADAVANAEGYKSSTNQQGSSNTPQPMQSTEQQTGIVQEPAQNEKKTFGGFLKNIGTSTANMIGSTAEAIAHPINTLKTLGGTAVGAVEKLIPGEQGQERYADALGKFFKDRYGSAEALGNTAYSDPVGFLTDLSTVLTGGGSVIAKLGDISKVGEASKLGNFASKVGEVVNPVNIPGKTKGLVSDLTEGVRNKAAAKLEEANLRLTPTQKGKLIKENIYNTPESNLDRTANIEDNAVIKYGTEKKLTGSPEERASKNQSIVDDMETQIDRAAKNSAQTVPKEQIVSELNNITEQFAGQPEMYDSVKSVIDKKINHINTKIKGNSLSMEELQNLKKDAWRASKFDSAVSNNTRVANRVSGHLFKNLVEDSFEKGGETIFGKTPKAFNEEYGKALAYQKLLEKAMGRNEIGLLGRGISSFVGNKIGGAVGGIPGEIAGTIVGEKVGQGLAGTKARARLGSILQGGDTKAPGLIRSAITKGKKVVKPAFYAGSINKNIAE